MTELLSPAGSWDALVAAVQSGADAVYMGFGAFNARQSARNFTDDEFASAVSYCHLRHVKVYLTLNTLVTDRELPAAADALRKANDMGVDAVLLQDWGLLALAREIVPDLPLHASTQMSLHTLGGAKTAAALGMERIVLARELSGHDIEVICRGCAAEIETFVHGALCMCYSGQCEMSALIGRRSGNRGRCAQPCRLPYGVNAPCRGDYPLSLKDANLSAHLAELDEMGVACLKIEGRMKRPEYVAAITGIYRRLLDEKRPPTPEEQRLLALAFSRDGFTEGYWNGKPGADMFGTRPADARWPEDWFADLRREYESGEHRTTPVTMHLSIRRDKPAVLTAQTAELAVTVSGAVPEAARNRALTAEELRDRLSKTGGTVFTAETVTVELDEGLMLPASAVNALRREALGQLEAQMTAPPRRRSLPVPALPEAESAPVAPLFTVSIERADQLTDELVACAPEIVYIPLPLLDKLDLQRYPQQKFCAVLPRIFRTEDEEKFRSLLQTTPNLAAVTIGNLGHLPIVEGLPLQKRGDFSLNVTNSRALYFLRQQGLCSATVSFELRHQQIGDLQKHLPCEAIVYGRLPLMITENCVTKNTVGCSHGDGSVLTDRTGARFPVLCAYGCRSEIENAKPLFLADKPEYRTVGLTYARLRFTTETPAECVSILRRYQNGGDQTPDDFTRGLFYRGVE